VVAWLSKVFLMRGIVDLSQEDYNTPCLL